MTPIIPANTTIPTRRSQIFTTAADNQTAVTIHVLQGERPMAADNVSLGMFNLVGIPPAPRGGIPQIEVTFDIDANGILHVSAVDKGSGKQQSIVINAKNKLTKEEIERMKREAEQFAEQDRKKKELVELINNAESLIYTSEKTLDELGSKVDDETKNKVRNTIKELREAIESKDEAKIRPIYDRLSKEIQEVGMKVYQQASAGQAGQQEQQSGGQSSQGGQGTSGEKVVDADYKEK